MADDVEKLLLLALSREIMPVLIVGEAAGARSLVRSCAGALENSNAIGFARDVEGWPAGPRIVASWSPVAGSPTSTWAGGVAPPKIT